MSPSTYALYDISSLVYELCQLSSDTFAEACDIAKFDKILSRVWIYK